MTLDERVPTVEKNRRNRLDRTLNISYLISVVAEKIFALACGVLKTGHVHSFYECGRIRAARRLSDGRKADTNADTANLNFAKLDVLIRD